MHDRAEFSRWETHAEAVIVTADGYQGEPAAPAPLKDAVPYANPYDGTVFHGPAFATLMDGARIGRNGSSGTLAVDRCKVPVGQQHPGLLDGAFHIVPHTAMNVWTTTVRLSRRISDATDPTVGFPRRVIWARFYGEPPEDGTVDVETRFVGFDDADEPHADHRSVALRRGQAVGLSPHGRYSCWTKDLSLRPAAPSGAPSSVSDARCPGCR